MEKIKNNDIAIASCNCRVGRIVQMKKLDVISNAVVTNKSDDVEKYIKTIKNLGKINFFSILYALQAS